MAALYTADARFSDPAFDALMEEARTTTGPAARDALLRRAQRLAFEQDEAIIPLHVPDNVWAHKASIAYEGGLEEATLAQRAHRK